MINVTHGTHDIFSPEDPGAKTYKMKIPYLCGGCHKKIVDKAASSKVKHPPVAKGECAKCHEYWL